LSLLAFRFLPSKISRNGLANAAGTRPWIPEFEKNTLKMRSVKTGLQSLRKQSRSLLRIYKIIAIIVKN
jgi:hypothetical protein